MLTGSTQPAKARLDVSPMLNVLMALLVVVALGAAVAGSRRALEHNQPTCPGIVDCQGGTYATVTVAGGHRFFWDNKGPYVITDFARQLAEQLKRTPHLHVLVASDKSAVFGDAVQVYDTIQRAGIPVATDTAARETPR